MTALDLISDIIPPLKTSDSGTRALSFMNEFHVSHLPIVNNKQFLGLIGEDDIIDLNEPDEPIGNHSLSLVKPYVNENQHIYEVIKVVNELKLTIVPVLSVKEKQYLGCITLDRLVAFFGKLNSTAEPGGIIMLSINQNDYSLSEISRIVESNDARLLSVQTLMPPNSTKMIVNIKVNKTDISHILATFERFEYEVSAYYHESDHLDQLKDRYDSLMHYLNV